MGRDSVSVMGHIYQPDLKFQSRVGRRQRGAALRAGKDPTRHQFFGRREGLEEYDVQVCQVCHSGALNVIMDAKFAVNLSRALLFLVMPLFVMRVMFVLIVTVEQS